MIGLLIKDWKLFKNQGRYFITILIIAMAVLMTGSAEYATFSTSYITFLVSYFALSTISYDEYDNGMGFLMALPVRRRTYVSEKYLLTVLLVGGAWLFSVGMNLICFHSNISDESFRELICTAPAFLLVAVVFLSISLPLFLKFGPERGRMVSFGILGVFFVVTFALAKSGIAAPKLNALDRISLDHPLPVFGSCLAFSIVFLGISYIVSIKLIEQKEF